MQSLENVKQIDLNNVAIGSLLGIDIIYADPGVPFYAPPSERHAVVVGVERSRFYGYYLIVKADGINIPRHITPEQVISYLWTRETAEVS